MISKSSDGKFDISEFDYAGMGDEKNCIGVNFRAKKGISITLIDVAKAIDECYSEYDINRRKLAPEIYAVIILSNDRTYEFKVNWELVLSNDRTYEFKVNWELEFSDYLILIARQIELQ